MKLLQHGTCAPPWANSIYFIIDVRKPTKSSITRQLIIIQICIIWIQCLLALVLLCWVRSVNPWFCSAELEKVGRGKFKVLITTFVRAGSGPYWWKATFISNCCRACLHCCQSTIFGVRSARWYQLSAKVVFKRDAYKLDCPPTFCWACAFLSVIIWSKTFVGL